jgi:hypothetical protein
MVPSGTGRGTARWEGLTGDSSFEQAARAIAIVAMPQQREIQWTVEKRMIFLLN